jgi:lysophospholipase L1-like esterase
MNHRRNFLKKSAVGAAGIAAVPLYVSAEMDLHVLQAVPENLTILMQGDSITDAGRDRGAYYPNDGRGMGNGYVYQVVAEMLGKNPGKGFRFYNRGISGNKVYQLAERWQDDALQLNPDVLSILIGVNDFWHTLSSGYKGTSDTFAADYRMLLDRTREALPDVKLMIGEPFAVKDGSAINESWYPEFNKYRAAVKKIAKDYDAVFVPYQEVFDSALKKAPAVYWCPDGVHPSIAGAWLMKEAWIRAFSGLF